MSRRSPQKSYESIAPSHLGRAATGLAARAQPRVWQDDKTVAADGKLQSDIANGPKSDSVILKRGHLLTYAGLFLFTLVLYLRPAELYPSPVTASLALIVGIITLALFVPAQLSLEGSVTAPLREVHLILFFAFIALVS